MQAYRTTTLKTINQDGLLRKQKKHRSWQMKNLTDLLIESESFAQKINRQLDISNSITQMLEAQKEWTNQLSAFSMHESLLKSIGQHHLLYANNFSGLDSIAKTIAMQPKFNIPTTVFDAINSISRQHEQLFGNLRSITDSWKLHNSAFAQMNNLQFALTGISGQMAAIAALHKQWGLLDDFKSISEQAIEITNNITADIALIEKESIRFEKLIEKILTFLKRNKKFGTGALLFLSVIVNLMALHQYCYDFVKEKPETATKEDLTKLERKFLQSIEVKLKEDKEYRTTNRICKVTLKRKSKTLVLAMLPSDFDLILLQVNHKWVYVSYINPTDNLPQTGWVMKKYLNQPK